MLVTKIRIGGDGMALIKIQFFSKVLGLMSTMSVLLPESDPLIGVGETVWDGTSELPALYLLHGSSDDHSTWLRRTSLERYLAGRRLAVVIPALESSYCVNQKYGYDYFRFITEEVPEVSERYFKISAKREDRFVAGLSMGGYAAMKLALCAPEKYSYAASLSGVVDYTTYCEDSGLDYSGGLAAERKLLEEGRLGDYYEIRDFRLNFGSLDEFRKSEDDLIRVLDDVDPAKLPKLNISCGTEDMLYHCNQMFCKKLEKQKVGFTYFETPGVHEWGVWDQNIQKVLDWLPVEKTGGSK